MKRLRKLEFAFRRLREAKTLIPINQDLIQPTLERYIGHLNSLTDKYQIKDEMVLKTQDSLSIHLKILELMHSQTSNLKAKMSIRSAMNRIIQRADVPDSAKIPTCAFFAKEASSSALNQTEQLVLMERAQKCRKID